jgi:hypothetical protein
MDLSLGPRLGRKGTGGDEDNVWVSLEFIGLIELSVD